MKTTFGGFSLMLPENQSSMSSVRIEQKSYEMPPRHGFTVTADGCGAKL